MDGLVTKYFVLKPEGHSPHAKASRKAMLAYSFEVEETNSLLAQEIREWVKKVDKPKPGCGCGYCKT